MFSSALRVGIRLKAWKTKPTRSRRSRVKAFSPRSVRFTPSIHTSPEVSESSPAKQCMSVLLPEPDGPMMAANRPTSKSTVTPAKAFTAVSPEP